MHLLRRFSEIFRRPKLDREMDMEMRMHLERETAQNIARGMSPDEARCAARRAFGGVDQLKERERDARGWRWIEEFFRDLRHGIRLLARSPGFTVVAVLTLALGIGINTSIFSVFKGVMLRPLPGVPASRDLVALHWTTQGGDETPLSYVELRDFRDRAQSLAGIEGADALAFSLDDGVRPQRIWGELATGGLHDLLGVKPAAGRVLQPEDDRFPGSALVVVVSHRLWQRQFGGDPGVVGRTLLLNGQPCTVVGVTEPEFAGTTVGFALDLFVPAAAVERLHPFDGDGTDLLTRRSRRQLAAVSRLRPGVSLAQARAEVAAIATALAREYPEEYEGRIARLVPIVDSPFGAQTYAGPVFSIMMGMTGLVLLIMCANVANLLLARATTRGHETAIRLALGAGRFRLVRQFMAESLLLALVGGALGGLLALGTPSLLSSVRAVSDVPIGINAEPDVTVLLFALVVSLVSAVAFGLLPALQCSRPAVLPALKTGRGNETPVRTRGRSLLVVTQIAFSILLLISAGLLLRSAQRQRQANLGFDRRHVALMAFDLGCGGYDEVRGREFCDRLLAAVRALPGVETASLSHQLPVQIRPRNRGPVEVDGYVPSPSEARNVLFNVVSPDIFRTLRIPLVAGRDFADTDVPGTERVAIINETMARRYWPGQDPIGRVFRGKGTARKIVGVVRDIKYLTPTEASQPYYYVPQSQRFESEMHVLVRTAGEPGALLEAARDRIAELDPHLPVFGVETMEAYMDFALSLPTLAAKSLLLSGGLALALTAMGVFGTVSFIVSTRTREIGVRMALGARSTDVVRFVVRHGFWLAGTGAVLGIAGAIAATRVLKSLLFEISTTDPATFAAVLLVIAMTTLVACWLPAWRATKVDPMIALRAE